MKTSIEWLKDYSDIDVSVKELADRLTMTGSKVEEIEQKGNNIKNVVVGKILEITRHPDADKLIVTKVNVGGQIVQIVTGADNVKVGDIIPIAKDGSELPNDVKIKKGMLRGVESCGMMCAVTELGLNIENYPDQIEHGIMILPQEYEKFIGFNIVDVLNLKEDIIDFEITPNRPDCLSIEGLGRETAVTLGKEFKNPHKNLLQEPKKIDNIDGLNVEIQAPDLCYRYIARVAKNVKIAPSPDWMKRRLNSCGIKSINNIVDITNYVMLELGQPMHAFDINSITGKQIIVRRAKENETIMTLDDEQRQLDTDMLVIADAEKTVAVAGVMGGQNSEIENTTTTVVFESAVFKGGNVRQTAKKIGLRTESSARFEKGLSPENALRAINRVAELIKELNAGDITEEIIDVYPTKQKETVIDFEPDRVNSLLGTNISKDEMIAILEKLEIQIKNGKLYIPYFREDIERTADIAEEVLRIYGYDKLGSTLINAESTIGLKNKKQELEDRIKTLLVDKGFSEMYAYDFYSPNDLKKCNAESNGVIKIKNPLGEDYSIMRTSMVPSVMQSIATNYNRKNKNVNLFELGKTYIDTNNNIEKGELPVETPKIVISTYGGNADFYIIKGILENILELSSVQRYQIEKSHDASLHPGKSANILVGKDVIATFGEINPAVSANYGIEEPVYFASIDTEKLVRYGKTNKKYSQITKFPAVERDIAIIIDEDIEVGEIEKVISKKCRDILEEIKLFDVYRNEKLGENKKSIAYKLVFRSKEKTLTDDEITGIMDTIISNLEKELDAHLRV